MAQARRAGSLIWLQGLVCGAVLTFATPVALLVGVLMAPALAAAVVETHPARPVTRASALACCAFTLAPLWRLLTGGRTMGLALDELADPAVTAPAWLGGACGWALCVVLPVVMRALSDMRATARTAALQAEGEALRDAWDLD